MKHLTKVLIEVWVVVAVIAILAIWALSRL